MDFDLLIVDDSRTTRGVIRKTLGLIDLPIGRVLEAGSGAEGLALLRSDWVDLVLADLNMPGMSGVEMIEAMNLDSLLSKVPVVVVSSEGNAALLTQLAGQGVRDFVRKPFQPAALKQVMQRSLGLIAAEAG